MKYISLVIFFALLAMVAPALAQKTSLQTWEKADVAKLPAYVPETKLEGSIRCYGSDLKGQMPVWEKGFLKYQPGIQFANNFTASSEGAMAGLFTGLADIGPAGDDAKITDRMPFYNVFHYLPLEISVATGGYEKRGTLWAIQIVVNRTNPISKLTMKQLEEIFGSERTGGWDGLKFTGKYALPRRDLIRRWGQLGLTGDWADKPIHTYGYASPGFAVDFERKVMHWSDKWNANFREFVEAKEATSNAYGVAVSSDRMLEELSKDKYGIAWAAVLHTKDYPEVKQVAIAFRRTGPYVEMTPQTVANHTYPLARNAYIYLNRPPGEALSPKVKEFMSYILSRQGQEDVARHGIYYPLTLKALLRQRENLK